MIEPFRHNSWATLRLLRFCRDLDPAVLDATAPGTSGSIKTMLAHMVNSEEHLISMVEGAPQQSDEWQQFTSLDDLEERVRLLADRWERCLDPIPHPERIVEVEVHGEGRLMRIGIVLAQAVHSGNEHRSQVCTVLGSLGVQPPVIDGWTYGKRLAEVQPQEQESW